MLIQTIYPVIQGFIAFIVLMVIVMMLARLIFNYLDPNPFGALGRLSFRLKKFTDRIVYPAASLLARLRIDTRIAPLLTILAAVVVGYFILQLFLNVLGTIDGVGQGFSDRSVMKIVGHLLYGFLAIYSLLIVIRIVLSWVLDFSNRLLRFLIKLTEPVLAPFRRIIPPLGMFDISAIVVLLLLNFLQIAVAGVLLR
jgi:uncharacterized protein YggT (Ycf19 family)